MGLIADMNTYLKWLTTTSLTMEEISLYIMTVEEAKRVATTTQGTWQVLTTGNKGKTIKVRMIIDNYTDNGNGSGNNGHVS